VHHSGDDQEEEVFVTKPETSKMTIIKKNDTSVFMGDGNK
jgi:hypothetical protein